MFVYFSRVYSTLKNHLSRPEHNTILPISYYYACVVERARNSRFLVNNDNVTMKYVSSIWWRWCLFMRGKSKGIIARYEFILSKLRARRVPGSIWGHMMWCVIDTCTRLKPTSVYVNKCALIHIRLDMLTLDDTVLDVAFTVGHVHGDRLNVRHVLELDTSYTRTIFVIL